MNKNAEQPVQRGQFHCSNALKSWFLATSPCYHGYHGETANTWADPEGSNGPGPPPLTKITNI